MKYAFLVSSLFFSFSHTYFFLRAFFLRNKNFRPGKQDIAARNISMIFMPVTAIVGSFRTESIVVIILWLPLIFIALSQFNRKLIKKNPYILPLLNTLLSVSILFIATGILYVT